MDLATLCKLFIGHKISFHYNFTFDDEVTQITNCNAIGDLTEDVFFPRYKKIIPTFEKGPKQASPDFWSDNKEFEYEQKVYQNNPCFDIGNFNSIINQLAEKDGVHRKLFKTRYLVFKYAIENNSIVIKNFNMLRIWNIVGYDKKYPITLQNKRGMWYNIRPSSAKDWNDPNKTPKLFITNIIKCIKKSPNKINNKDEMIKSITDQFNNLKDSFEDFNDNRRCDHISK
ncbi:NgoBV family restriction endonuclease [Aureispira]|nr:NgoBV family restriction endonuclease [Aureispira sp.]